MAFDINETIKKFASDKDEDFLKSAESRSSFQDFLRNEQGEDGNRLYTDEQVGAFDNMTDLYSEVSNTPRTPNERVVMDFTYTVTARDDWESNKDNPAYMKYVLESSGFSKEDQKYIKMSLKNDGIDIGENGSSVTSLFDAHHRYRDERLGVFGLGAKEKEKAAEEKGMFDGVGDSFGRSRKSNDIYSSTDDLIMGAPEVPDDISDPYVTTYKPASQADQEAFTKDSALGMTQSIIERDKIPVNESLAAVMKEGMTIEQAVDAVAEHPDALIHMVAESGVSALKQMGAQAGVSLATAVGTRHPTLAIATGAGAGADVARRDTLNGFYSQEVEKYIQQKGIELKPENAEQIQSAIIEFRNDEGLHNEALDKAKTYSNVIGAATFASGSLGGYLAPSVTKIAQASGMQFIKEGGKLILKSVGAAGAATSADIAGEVVGKRAIGEEAEAGELVAAGAAGLAGSVGDIATGVAAKAIGSDGTQAGTQETPDTPTGPDIGGLIAKHEGDYGSYNQGRAGDAGGKTINFAEMTVEELTRRQSLPKGDADRVFAFGKYQIIPSTMKEAVKALGIPPDQQVTPQLQEAIFRDYLFKAKRPDLYGYVTGQHNDLNKAIKAGSMEWASIENPDTGRSYYDKVGNNKAATSAKEFGDAITGVRKAYQQAIANGMSENDAYASAMQIAGPAATVTQQPSPPRRAYNPRESHERNQPKHRLWDNHDNFIERNRQRSAMSSENAFMDSWKADTEGRGRKEVIDKAMDAFNRSRIAGEDLIKSYAAAANKVPNDKRHGEFYQRLRGLGSDVPVIDDTVIGQTGLSQRALIDAIEDKDSAFYSNFESSSIRKITQENVGNGDREAVINAIRLEADNTKDSQKSILFNAFADQLEAPSRPTAENVLEAATNFSKDDDGHMQTVIQSKIDSDEFDGTMPSAFSVMNKAHNQFMGDRIGTVQSAFEYMGGKELEAQLKAMRRDADSRDVVDGQPEGYDPTAETELRQQITQLYTKARMASNIFNKATHSTQAAASLAKMNNPELNRIAEKIVSDRMFVDTGIGSDTFNERLSALSSNHDTQLGDTAVNSDYVTKRAVSKDSKPEATTTETKAEQPPVRDKTFFKRARDFARRNFTQKFGLPKDIFENEVQLIGAVATDSGMQAQKFFLNRLAERQRTLSKEEDLAISQYLRGEPVSLPNDLVDDVQWAKEKIEGLSAKVRDKMFETQDLLARLDIDTDFDALIDTIENNMGSYLNTSYDAYESRAKWEKDLKKGDLRERAIAEAKADGVAEPEAEIQRVIEGVKNNESQVDFFINVVGENSVLKEKKDLPDWLKTVLGVRESGVENIGNTVRKQEELFRRIEMENYTVSSMADLGWISNQPKQGYVEIKQTSPIYNKYSAMQKVHMDEVHYEYLLSLRNVLAKQDAKEDKRFLKAYNATNYLTKFNWTVGNNKSWFTQVLGASIMGAMHGLWQPWKYVGKGDNVGYLSRMVSEFNADAKAGKETPLRQTAIKYGILDSADTADLQGAIGTYSDMLDRQGDVKGSSTTAGEKVSSVANKLARGYGAPDRAVKFLTFLDRVHQERRTLARDIAEGRLAEDTDIETMALKNAGEFAATVLPTPVRSVGFVKKLRSPKTGAAAFISLFTTPFLTFQVGMPYAMWNKAQYIGKHWNSPNIERKRHARFLGVSMIATTGYFTQSIWGDDSFGTWFNDDEIEPQDNQDMMSRWYRSKEVQNMEFDEDWNLRYYVSEYINPISFMSGNVQAMVKATTSDEFDAGDYADYLTSWTRDYISGGNAISDGVKGLLDIVQGEETVEKKLQGFSAWNMNPTIKSLKEGYDLHNEIETSDKDTRVNNYYLSQIRLGTRTESYADVAKNIGFGIKDSANERQFRKEFAKLNKNENTFADVADEFVDYNQKKLDKLWDVLPQLDRIYRAGEGQPIQNVHRFTELVRRSAGFKKGVISKHLEMYRNGEEQPTLTKSGLINPSNPVDISKKDFYKDVKTDQKKVNTRRYYELKQRQVNKILMERIRKGEI